MCQSTTTRTSRLSVVSLCPSTPTCRRVDPLELALREGQFACAAVLIEGGAHIEEGTFRALKLEPAGVASSGTR